MPVIEFQMSLAQAALTGMRIKQTKKRYKLALKISASTVFQQMKFKYGTGIADLAPMLENDSLVSYFCYKISEMIPLSYKEILP